MPRTSLGPSALRLKAKEYISLVDITRIDSV